MRTYLLLLLLILASSSQAQLVSGPMLGDVDMRSAKIWMEVEIGSEVMLDWVEEYPGLQSDFRGWTMYGFQYIVYEVYGLEPGTVYEYQVSASQPEAAAAEVMEGSIRTADLWAYRKPAPDITFITGSCAYINEPKYDRPGKPYGSSPEIFRTMAKEKADACIWLGDNWYYRDPDYYSEYGLYYRAHHDRAVPEMQSLLRAMPHYAIWDDHDYGPNNANSSYIFKDKSRDVFRNYWLNPSYGANGEGIYTRVALSDVEIFLLDTRWFRDADDMMDTAKAFIGDEQMRWLQNALLASRATFKVICTGSQVLNYASKYDRYIDYEHEYEEFMRFLNAHKIPGVLFLSGDRHHSSVFRNTAVGPYTLYDITVSPFTSGTYPFSGAEKNPPDRLVGIAEKQNYARFSVTGGYRDRLLQVDFLGTDGSVIDSWSVHQNELKPKK